MKKKVFSVSLIVVLLILTLVSLTGCGNSESKNISKQESNESNIQETTLQNITETYSVNETENGFEVINSKNEVQFETSDYDYLEIVDEGKLVKAQKGNLIGYLDINGNKVTEIKYWGMDNTVNSEKFHNGYIIIEDEISGKKGLLYEDGTEVISMSYTYMSYDEDEKLYLVDSNSFPRDGSAFYINEKNEKVKDW